MLWYFYTGRDHYGLSQGTTQLKMFLICYNSKTCLMDLLKFKVGYFWIFFFLLENLFSRDNQRLGCQVSNLTIFSFSSYHFFFISSECKQSAKIDPSSENLQTGMHYILIPLEF